MVTPSLAVPLAPRTPDVSYYETPTCVSQVHGKGKSPSGKGVLPANAHHSGGPGRPPGVHHTEPSKYYVGLSHKLADTKGRPDVLGIGPCPFFKADVF
jgi:hypothetical protein